MCVPRLCCESPASLTSRLNLTSRETCSRDKKDMDSIVVRVEGIAPVSADDAAAVADLLCSLDGVQKSDFTVSSVDNKGETATARISCSGADVAEALVQKIHGE